MLRDVVNRSARTIGCDGPDRDNRRMSVFVLRIPLPARRAGAVPARRESRAAGYGPVRRNGSLSGCAARRRCGAGAGGRRRPGPVADARLGRGRWLAGAAVVGARQDRAGGGAGDGCADRLRAELGYGLSVFGDRFTGTPNVGFGLSGCPGQACGAGTVLPIVGQVDGARETGRSEGRVDNRLVANNIDASNIVGVEP